MSPTVTVDLNFANEILAYDGEQGRFTWKARHEEYFGSSSANIGYARGWNKKYAGTFADTVLDDKGYRTIRVRGQKLLAHRVAYAFAHGRWPTKAIDHIDGDRTNNVAGNLREASDFENSRNRGIFRNNNSGTIGVFFRDRDNRWIASIGDKGRQIHLGSFMDEQSAIAARRNAESSLNYHPNHGARAAFTRCAKKG